MRQLKRPNACGSLAGLGAEGSYAGKSLMKEFVSFWSEQEEHKLWVKKTEMKGGSVPVWVH